MTPTEHEATVAVEAAARVAWDRQRAEAERAGVPTLGDWEDIGALNQNYYREVVLPLVWAALEALPDRRAAAWDEGVEAGFDARAEQDSSIFGRNPYREAP